MGLAILTLGIFALVNGSEASKQTCHQFINKTLVVGNDSTTHRPLDVAKYVTYDLNHAHFMYVIMFSDYFSKSVLIILQKK